MSDSNPLAGLTSDQADEAISRLAEKVDQLKESLKVASEHLKEMRAARKTHTGPGDNGAVGVEARAGLADASGKVG